jgi:hypothetical protein
MMVQFVLGIGMIIVLYILQYQELTVNIGMFPFMLTFHLF